MSAITLWPDTNPMWPDTKLITLQKILQSTNSGGGSGSGNIQVYQDRHPSAPDNPALAALSYDSGTGVLFHWNIGGASWV
jgi:hypothetical protein